MQNSGITPDCVHCRFMVRQQNGEYRCRQHDMILHSPVRLFCKNLAPSIETDDYQQWFDKLELDKLDANTLYTWVDTIIRDAQGETEIHVDPEMIAPMTTYIAWSAGTFWQILRKIRKDKRDHYRKHGYNVEE